MSKYNFVLYAGQCSDFLERLREIGLVDITTTGWEPSEQDRTLILELESQSKAIAALKDFAGSEAMDSTAKGYASGEDAFAKYGALQQTIAQLKAQREQLQKTVEEMTPWGDFSMDTLKALSDSGVKLHYFIAQPSVFESQREAWLQSYTIEPIAESGGKLYFVLIERGEGAAIDIDAQEIKAPTMSASEARAQIVTVDAERSALDGQMSRCAVSLPLIEEYGASLLSTLQDRRVSSSAQSAADGSLLIMEAWAASESSAEVDKLLEEYPNVVYLKSDPTPEDNTPVQLKNGWYASMFELIGNLYALPKYGTIDLTPLFAPFYMLFFAICLCDAGYGLMILLAGLGLYFKGGALMRQPAWLTILCGSTAVVFGFLANSIFGMEFSSLPLFASFPFIDFQLQFFSASMIIGVVQILFGMVVNICVSTRMFGIKSALGSIGWFLLLVSCLLSAALTQFGIEGFGFDSVPFYIMAGVGAVLLLFFNSPDKNIFANFGAGLWKTYENITGLLGDILSYIRLFAIGLSGGVLALVFNDLAMGMTGLDQGIAGQPIFGVILQIIGASLILLLGHGINLFMSTISSFVHPMRLTFVEFYKNAGFEIGVRKFEPLKK